MPTRRKHSHACKATISDAMGMATSKSVLQISSAFLLLATRGSRRLRPLLLPLLLPFPLPPGAGKHTPGPTQKICPSPCCSKSERAQWCTWHQAVLTRERSPEPTLISGCEPPCALVCPPSSGDEELLRPEQLVKQLLAICGQRLPAKECRRLRLRLRLGVVLGEEGLPLSRQGLTRLV